MSEPEQQRNDKFLYLNRDNGWLDFHRDGLELRADGSLQLHALPLFTGALPEELPPIDDLDGPAGIAVEADGTVYFTVPSTHRLWKIDGCDGSVMPVVCIGGEGRTHSRLNQPRGLLIPQYRHSLLVADSLNHRVAIFDIGSTQIVDTWDRYPLPAESPSGANFGELITPWTLAGDNSGNVYVVDHGNHSVQKFNRAGDVVSGFGETLSAANVLTAPGDIAAWSGGETTRLYITDESQRLVFVFDEDGNPILNEDGYPISIGASQLQKPMGLAVGEEGVYVGDNGLRGVLKFKNGDDYGFIGEAVGYDGPVAALALDGKGNLLIHAGKTLAPIRLSVNQGYRQRGVLWSNPINVGSLKVSWHRVLAVTEELANDAHLRLFVHTSNDETDEPQVDPDSDDPFSDSRWIPGRPTVASPDPYLDVNDLFIGGAPSAYLWVGVLFESEGKTTPVVSQMRVEFDHRSYLEDLPAIYRMTDGGSDFLLRFVSLFETFFGGIEGEIDGLSRLFEPQAAPKQLLPWLASWLALELDEDWDEKRQRDAIAAAFDRYARRGTADGLRRALLDLTQVNAIIDEPILNSSWWLLPAPAGSCKCGQACRNLAEGSWQATGNSILGTTTMLASAQPQGAVVGATATLDYSHLITNQDFGAPLFEDLAHQFNIQIYRSELGCAATLPKIKAVIEREKPAHTAYHLCIIEPRLRVGFQARVGIDAVVGGQPGMMKLDEAMIGEETALGGEASGRIGDSRVGVTTRAG
jgi:phage tail-like protein